MEISSQMLVNFKEGRMDGFYATAYPSLICFAARHLGSDLSFLSEDCVQEAIYKAYGQRLAFNSPFQLKSFLYACVHNNAISILRKNRSHNNYLSQVEEMSEDLSTAIIHQNTLDLISEAIDSLPEDMRKLFDLSFGEGMKNAAVAELMGVSESAVKKRKSKMMALLRARLGGDELAIVAVNAIISFYAH